MHSKNRSVVIVGAGFGGIAAAIALKKHGYENFMILEKAFDVGGTWRENKYPGCTSDVSIHYYSLSTDLKDDWDHTCEFAYNIHAYTKDIVAKNNLTSHILFGVKVISATWDATSQSYTITTEDVRSQKLSVLEANIVISAHGILHVPRYPNIPGLNDFSGPIMHTAKWDTNLDLRGKKIAVIGNGGSACQLVPYVAKTEGVQLTHFVRTRNWILPAMVAPIHRYWKWAFRHIPFLTRLFRWTMFWVFEASFYLIFKMATTRAFLMKAGKKFMNDTAPKKYRGLLEPSFPLGCRRIVFDSGYLASLHRPNVDLKEGGDIVSVDSTGIIMKTGEKLPFDVIACGTGFVTDKFPYHLRGRESTIQEFYDKHDGPLAYLGTTVPGFPNFFMINGPNTATGYTSLLHIMQLVKPILDNEVTSFEVTPKANDDYNKGLQSKLNDMVFSFCSSWYRAGHNGRNVSIFPGSALQFWWACRKIDWSHYVAVGPNAAKFSNSGLGFVPILSAVVLSASMLWWTLGN
ncbi:Baeyer-Villiger monooxygenase [Psilocybe cubensis]|uniref:Baeyer-Villiger monooxygenase n=2 Tax=Psilocybe cubensis TaxID=181762 RepID=A0ACB8GZZ7_PSICU|nr:Baeyer-Villiger monooxygenase [Psilocybe cubensis]KAH9481223.1 Baeyer-Villiger monooxygenase [Psilocybe cubensis]